MPLVARLASPGRSDQLPPPTRETMEAWWCGRPEGRALQQNAVGQGAAGGRVDAGHREGVVRA